MAHARGLKRPEVDHSVDEAITIDESLRGADRYVYVTFFAYMLMKIWVWPMLFLTLFTPVAISQVYISLLPTPTIAVSRTAPGFILMSTLAFFFFIPAVPMIAISYFFDMLFYHAFGFLWILFTCQWSNYSASQAALAPYRGGPWVVTHLADVFVSIIGQGNRHGTLEIAALLTNMIFAIPTLKYWVNSNALVYKIRERFVQQITTSMQDMPQDAVADAVRRIISRTKQKPELAKKLDDWKFVPHYPYPPPSRRYAIGMQQINSFATLLVHVTHYRAPHQSPAEGASRIETTAYEKEMEVISNSCEQPIYRVMLWYSNPFHFLTGWVEASVSNGKHSQLDKTMGGEHPMWIVGPNSPMLNERRAFSGIGVVDRFFDRWLPTIVDEIRTINRGADIAAQLHEETISKDGISRPAGIKVVPSVDPASTASTAAATAGPTVVVVRQEEATPAPSAAGEIYPVVQD